MTFVRVDLVPKILHGSWACTGSPDTIGRAVLGKLRMNSKKKGSMESKIGKILPIGLFLLMLSSLFLVALRREPDLSDECYVYYEAQAAWDAGNQSGGSDPIHRLFGSIVGLPFLWNPESDLLSLRMYSMMLWLFGFSLLSWSVAGEASETRGLWLLPLPLLLHTLHMPVLTYQSLPAVFLAIAFACRIQASRATPRGRGCWLFALGSVCGFLPLTHVPLLIPFILLFLWMLIQESSVKGRLTLSLGFTLSFSAVRFIWFANGELYAARNAWLFSLPPLPPTPDAGVMTHHLSAARIMSDFRVPRLLEGIMMVIFCLGAGRLLRTPLTRLLAAPRGWTRLELLQVLGLALFLTLWFLHVRKDRTLCGLFSLGLLILLPTLVHGTRHLPSCTRPFNALAGTAILFGLLHSLTGSLTTATYYPTFYFPLVWIPACHLAIRALPRQHLTFTYKVLIFLNLVILFTHGHRAAGVLEQPRVRTGIAPFERLSFTPARADAVKFAHQQVSAIKKNTLLLGLHQQPFVYLLADQAAPWGNAWMHQPYPGLFHLVHARSNEQRLIVFTHAERGGNRKRQRGQLSLLFERRSYKTHPLGDGILLSDEIPLSSNRLRESYHP